MPRWVVGFTGDRLPPTRRICGGVGSGPQRHGMRADAVSRSSSAVLTRAPFEQDLEDRCPGEPRVVVGRDLDEPYEELEAKAKTPLTGK